MVDANFKKAVENKNVADIRDFLRMRLTLDHNYTSGMFIECRDYCLSHGITEHSLYQTFDGRLPSHANTEETFTKLLGQLSTNFAKERITKLLEIGKTLWPDEQLTTEESEVSGIHTAGTVHNTASNASSKRRIISERPFNGESDVRNTGAFPHTADNASSERRKISERPLFGEDKTEPYATGSSAHYSNSNADRQNTQSTGQKISTPVIIAGAAAAVAIIILAALISG